MGHKRAFRGVSRVRAFARLESCWWATIVVLAVISAPAFAQTSANADSPDRKPVAVAPAKAGAEALGKVIPVRVGAHKGFTRVVFDWPTAIDYGVQQKAGTVSIRFRSNARIDLSQLAAGKSPMVASAKAESAAGSTIVSIKAIDGARVRHFRTGSGVVLDLLKPLTLGEPGSGPIAGQLAEKTSVTSPPKTMRGLASAPPASPGRVAPPAKAGAPTNLATKAPAAPVAKAADNATAQAPPKSLKATAPPPKAVDRNRISQGRRASAGKTAPPVKAKPSMPRRLDVAAAASGSKARSGIPVALSLRPQEAIVRFNWEAPVGAAVFLRGGHLWVVFDRQSGMSFEGWEKTKRKKGRRSRQSRRNRPSWAGRLGQPSGRQVPGNTIFRMALPRGIVPKVEKEDHTWVVRLGQGIEPPVAGIPVEAHFSPVAGGRLHLTVHKAGPAAAIRDPEAGDLIWVVPVKQSGKGIGLGRTFAEVKLLPTAQGIVGRALRDGVVFKSLGQGVEITAPGGLSLSGTNTPGRVGRPALTQGPRGRSGRQSWLFEIGKMYQPSGAAFARASHQFLEAAYKASPSSQSRARLRLAQLYFANGRFSDAAGILQVIEADEPEFVNDPVFRALRGASYFFRGEMKRARRDLFHTNLDPYSEISLWRGAVEAVDGNWAAASRMFSRAEEIIRYYPRELRIRFGLLAAETALHVGDVALIKYHLETLNSLKPEASLQPHLNFLHGQLFALTLDPEGAVEAWTKAIEGPDPKFRVHAALARTEMLLKHRKITLDEATKELEKLRYTWRGDDLEFRVLTRLGRAYLDAGDFKNGLLTLRDAARHYPKNPGTDRVIDRMRAAFVKLYAGGKADKMAPLVSLALYDEFRELTPSGKVGNDLIAKLARRLVGVDLLDRSARLLKHLVDERLTGTDRLKAANQLALVYLLDRKPDLALSVLSGELPPGLAPKIAAMRRHLRARALGEVARFKEALQLLKGDTSRDAELLRAELYWRLKNWGPAANAYQALVRLTPAGKKGKSEDKRQRYVLSLAISVALSGDGRRLEAVRKEFAAEMAKGRYRDAFNLVSGQSGPVPNNYEVISRKVAEVDLFQTFMKTYREKLLPPPAAAKTSDEKIPAGKG